ncbi:hypothetical protein EHS13_29540 [Paenibacillus psychroresistens]|uniref:Uncharacterized protein n=1 Tax=Paenibacillus psychroresistens TaxID=1778678 RepID=A0A6B8RRZ8_9BACL|nr:hypothetical protein [Paenibacillus psychroresistens]QGQ98729.1 hypothetical protein EHS13_29540 [Paenibacillus psychroresistens]
MPVAIFGSLLVTLQNELSYTFKWWVVEKTIFPWVITYVPFVYGAFLVGTIWIFHFTFGRFWLYLITNIIMDLFFAFPMNYWFNKLKLYQLVNYTSWNVFFTFVGLSIVIYGYQLWQEGVLIKPAQEEDKRNTKKIDFNYWGGSKKRAR